MESYELSLIHRDNTYLHIPVLTYLFILLIHNFVVKEGNTPIQEKTGSCMEARPKGPSAFAAPGGKNKRLSKKVSRPSK